MRGPTVRPTLVIVGLNRSGTTAFSHALLNHPEIEVFKDPGKYVYESTGMVDFSHFFQPPLTSMTRVRVIKQSIGQYTPELCTIPVYPMGDERPAFLRKLHHIYLVRHPRQIWQSWQTMTDWLNNTTDEVVTSHWRDIVRDKGIPVGWGSFSLFHLAMSYFKETFEFIRSVAPESTYVLPHEDLMNRVTAQRVMAALCDRLAISYTQDMIDWRIKFGSGEQVRLRDGFKRPLEHPERRYIHRNILASDGLGRQPLKPSLNETAPWPDRAAGKELEDAYRVMLQHSRGSHSLLQGEA
ncbi:hypothetical protein ACF07F_15765 [Streptomyces sp. NPDC015237]|uniref:hypothetical protein n=1 Tax=Streptomyces sp. NPDC015237 TaxID=3364949 RepID=UPI0036F9834C